MQEQLAAQLVQVLQERVGLDAEKATQVAQVVADFAHEHLPQLLQLATGGEGGAGGLLGGLGGLPGDRG